MLFYITSAPGDKSFININILLNRNINGININNLILGNINNSWNIYNPPPAFLFKRNYIGLLLPFSGNKVSQIIILDPEIYNIIGNFAKKAAVILRKLII